MGGSASLTLPGWRQMMRVPARYPRAVEGSMVPESSLWRMNEAMKSRRETLEEGAPPKSPSSTMSASRARSACLCVLATRVW